MNPVSERRHCDFTVDDKGDVGSRAEQHMAAVFSDSKSAIAIANDVRRRDNLDQV